MVDKKQTKITVELIAKRRVLCIRPMMPQEQRLKEKEENIYSPKITKCSSRKKLPVSGNTVLKKDVRAIAGQHCNVNLRNNTNHDRIWSSDSQMGGKAYKVIYTENMSKLPGIINRKMS